MKTMVLLGAQMRQKAGQVNWFLIGNKRNSKLALNLLSYLSDKQVFIQKTLCWHGGH